MTRSSVLIVSYWQRVSVSSETKGAPAELQQAATDTRQLLSQVCNATVILLPLFILHLCAHLPIHNPLRCSAGRGHVLIVPLCRPEVLGEWQTYTDTLHDCSMLTSLLIIFFLGHFYQSSDVLGELCVLMLVQKSKVPHYPVISLRNLRKQWRADAFDMTQQHISYNGCFVLFSGTEGARSKQKSTYDSFSSYFSPKWFKWQYDNLSYD